MAKRGRKPKLQVAPEPGPCPQPPDWLSDRGKAEWHRLAETLNKLGLLEVLDRDVLALYCDAFDGYLTARDHIAEHGAIIYVGEHNSPQQSPYVTIAKANSKAMLDMMQLMGLNPASRSGLLGTTSCEPPSAEKKASPLEELTKRMQKRGGVPSQN